MTENWTRLLLSYARHRRLFYLRVEDAETKGGEWDEVLKNERINRAYRCCLVHDFSSHWRGRDLGQLKPSHLSFIMADMVSKNLAVYEPPKQTRTALLHWRLPEEWAEVLHEWVRLATSYPYFDYNAAPPGHLHGAAQHHPHIL